MLLESLNIPLTYAPDEPRLFLLREIPEDPQIKPHARIKMAQGLVSPVGISLLYICVWDTDFQEWRQFMVKVGRKKTAFVFGFWLMACENIDFVTQYLANNRIFGDAEADFSCQVYLLVNPRVKQIVIWHTF